MILADGHVHIYACFDPGRVLDSAVRHFAAAGRFFRLEGPAPGLLLLTESAGYDFFQSLEKSGAEFSNHWKIRPTAEPVAVWAERADGVRVGLIAGRQTPSAEGLEVLSLGARQTFSDGAPLADLLRQTAAAGALPVLPWGVGKWLGRRGALVDRVIRDVHWAEVALGDISGRPGFWPAPQFRHAARKGIRILPGTDPLPLKSEAQRIAARGFLIPADLSPERPWSSVRQALNNFYVKIEPYGKCEHPLRFFFNQARLRLGARRR